jgi:hypothetical protein
VPAASSVALPDDGIKLPEKESGADRTALNGHALHDVRRRSQSNEEDRYMTESDMNGAEGEISAIYRGGVRYAEV